MEHTQHRVIKFLSLCSILDLCHRCWCRRTAAAAAAAATMRKVLRFEQIVCNAQKLLLIHILDQVIRLVLQPLAKHTLRIAVQ